MICGVNQIDLRMKERTALLYLEPEGVAIVGGSTLQHIRDIDAFPGQADAEEHGAQQGSCSTHERHTLLVFLCPGGLSHEEPTAALCRGLVPASVRKSKSVSALSGALEKIRFK